MKSILFAFMLFQGVNLFSQVRISIVASNQSNATSDTDSKINSEQNEIIIQNKLNGSIVILSGTNPVPSKKPFSFVFGKSDKLPLTLGSNKFIFNSSGVVNGYPGTPQLLTFPANIKIIDNKGNTILDKSISNPLENANDSGSTGKTNNLTIIHTNRLTKIPYYDASLLANYKNALKRKEYIEILNYYIGDSTITDTSVLISKYQNNIFLKDIISKALSDASWDNDVKLHGFGSLDLSGFSSSSIGGLNVTNFADGLAKFLVKRFKEELTITFFERFQDSLKTNIELQTLFPETAKVLITIDKQIYQFSAYLNTLREAFIKDLTNLYTNFEKFKKLEKFKVYFAAHIDLNTIITNALYLIDEYAKSVHPGDVIKNYNTDDLKFKDTILQTNFRSSVSVLQIFSNSMKSLSASNYWVPADSVRSLLNNADTRNIYFGLIFQLGSKINFMKADNSLLAFQTVLAKSKDAIDQYQLFVETISEHAQEVVEYISDVKNKKKSEIDYNDYYKIYNASLDVLQDAFSFVDLPYIKDNIDSALKSNLKIKSGSWLFISRSAGEVYVDIRTKNYSSAILNVVGIIDTIFINYEKNNSLRSAILKYGSFAATVASAQNSDDVEQAIESIALPSGSSRVKRESSFNISINAFVGLYGGREILPALKENKTAWTTGLTAPVGVAFSFGDLKGRKDPKVGGKSLSIFIPLIDVGAIAAFRLQNDSSNITSDIKLANIISPGLYLYYGFGKCPISLGGGFQVGPQLRTVTATDINVNKNYYFRFGINLVVDIPMFNLYTKSKSN